MKTQTIGNYTLYCNDLPSKLPPSVHKNSARPVDIYAVSDDLVVIETRGSYTEIPVAVMRAWLQEYEKWKEHNDPRE